MNSPLRIGIAGLGTVGTGVVKTLQQNADLIAARSGRTVEIMAVSAKTKNKDRGVDVSSYEWLDDPFALATHEDIDVIVELIGGSEGPAKDLIEAALAAKKHVVTANKALMAAHGFELARLAEQNGVSLNYEAAVAGGIPVIKLIREGLAGNSIQSVYGILNGTCNYIFTEMRETGRDFDDVLKEAQEKGYAEADPSFDVDGIDAAHKLVILSALAFGVKPDFDALDITGIRHITAGDIQFAGELGYKIKLLGIARREDGKIIQSLEPCLVPADGALGSVEGVFNAVFVQGDFVDKSMAEGRGAGEGPTASSVVADIIDIARGIQLPTFGIAADHLIDAEYAEQKEIMGRYYLHLRVLDRPGVIADVSAILRDHDISIEAFLQRGRDPEQTVSVVIVTHEASQAAMRAAVSEIHNLSTVTDAPTLVRIEQV